MTSETCLHPEDELGILFSHSEDDETEPRTVYCGRCGKRWKIANPADHIIADHEQARRVPELERANEVLRNAAASRAEEVLSLSREITRLSCRCNCGVQP